MNSRLYAGHVLHARFTPKKHRFTYRIFMLAVDLDELPALHRRLRLFSVNRLNLYSLREIDYLPITAPLHNATAQAVSGTATTERHSTSVTLTPPDAVAPGAIGSLKTRALAVFATHGVNLDPHARIELITVPRLFGYAFNPVSFYFAYDSTGACLASLVEVTNTFHETKHYFLGPEHRLASPPATSPAAFHTRTPKYFYVSPFSDVDVAFDFQLRAPTEKLAIQIDNYVGSQRTLTSHLSGAAQPLSDGKLAWFTLSYPLLALRIISLIHWHALRLFLKKIPWFAKKDRPADQRDLYHPHPSIASPASSPASRTTPPPSPPVA